MNKQEFIRILAERLKDLPQEEREKSVAYYAEIIDDRMEDGISEAEAVAAIGNPEQAAQQILANTSLPQIKKNRVLRGWEIALLILGFPLWGSLLLAFFAVTFSLYIVMWAVIIVFYAAVLSFAIGALAGLFSCGVLFFTATPLKAIFLLGIALFLTGLAILSLLGVNKLTVYFVHCSGRFIKWIKSVFVKRGNRK